MVINAYRTYNIPSKQESKIPLNQIVKEIANKLIIYNTKIIEEENIDAIKKVLDTLIVNDYHIIDREQLESIIRQVLDKIYGYGLLEKYIKDGITSDIRVVRFNKIYIKQKGEWKETNDSFESQNEFDDYIRFCALKNNFNINFETPLAVFSDRKNGLRIEAGIEPVNIFNSSLVIRIHRKNMPSTLEKLFVQYEMLDCESYKFLKNSMKKRQNVILCGKGGSGKTTLLRALINELPKEMALTTNEETAELYLEGRNVIQRECILTRSENKNIDLEKLARHALVMSNDAIIIGELKGAEANSFFDAISTGHMGLATIHSDSAKNTIDRIITLIKKDVKATHYTEEFLRRFLASSIDYIIYMKEYKVNNLVSVKYNEQTNKLEFEEVYNRG